MAKLAVVLVLLSVHSLCLVVDGASHHVFGPVCPDRPADVVFLIDGSGSEGTRNFQHQLDFVKNFSANFNIGSKGVQVGLVQFATGARPEFELKDSGNSHQLEAALSKVHWWNGETYTFDGLQYVRENSFKQSNGARSGVVRMVVVLTDGQSTNATATAQEAALLKRDHVKVVAVGIGDQVSHTELLAIASDRRHVFMVPNFDALHTVQADLHNYTCELCEPTPVDIAFLLDGSGSESTGFQYEKELVKTIADSFPLGKDAARVSVDVFSTAAYSALQLDSNLTGHALHAAVDNIQYPDGESNLHMGLDLLRIKTLKTPRYGSKRVAIVITDGHSTEPDLTLRSAANLRAAGVDVIVVGVGSNLNQDQLVAIAGNKSNVLTTPSSSQLPNLADKISRLICASHLIYTTPVPPTTTPTTPASTTPQPRKECGPEPMDIVFLMDSSDSEGHENFDKQKDFVESFVRQFVVGPNNTQVSVLTFSDKARTDFFLNAYSNRHDAATAIRNISYIGSSTNTAGGLRLAGDQHFTKEHGMREGANHVAVIITDGRSDNETLTLAEAAALKRRHITVISIGVGLGQDTSELRAMASSSRYVFTADNFDALRTIQRQFTATTCHEVTDPPTTAPPPTTTPAPREACGEKMADIVFLMDSSDSVGADNFNKEKQFIETFANQFRVGPQNVQIGVETFSDTVHHEIGLGDFKHRAELVTAIRNISYVGAGTNTGSALNYARTHSFSSAFGARSQSNRIVVVITDGRSDNSTVTLKEAADLKHSNVQVLSVGIGLGQDTAELKAMATDGHHVFTVDSFDALHTIKQSLTDTACRHSG